MSKATVTAVLARDGHRCQAHAYGFDLVTGCAGRVHLHHRRLRSQGGTDALSNLVCVCELHHTRAHSQIRAEAETAGIIVRSSVLDT
jgi:hypothetical protein